jgi:hypothetical protein
MNNATKTPIDSGQTRKIHTLKSALKMTDEQYRKLINLNFDPATSSKELTYKQAEFFITKLEEIAVSKGVWVKHEGKGRYENLGCREGMATPKQLRLVEYLWKDVSIIKEPKNRQKALRAWLQKRFGVSDLRFLDRSVTSKVIYALNQMKKCKNRNRPGSTIPGKEAIG